MADSNSYKLAYKQAQSEHNATVARCQARLDALSKKGSYTANDQKEIRKLQQEIADSNIRLTNATNQYRIYTDKQMLSGSSMSEDKIKEAIYNDPIIQNNLKVQQDTENLSSSVTTSKYNTFDENYNAVNSDSSGILNGISSAISGVVDSVANTASRLSDLASDAGNKISDLFSSDSKKNEQAKALAGHAADAGQKETQTKVKQVSADNHGAIKNPPAYTTKPVVEVTENTKSAPTEQKKEELPKDGPLSKVGEKLKETTSSVTVTMQDVVTSVSNEVSDNVKKASGVINDVKSTMQSGIDAGKKVVSTVKESIDGVVDTAADAVSSVTSSITSMTAPVFNTVSDVVSAGKDLTNELSSSLPGPLGQFVKNKSDAYFNNVVYNVANSKLGRAQTLLSSLNGLGKSGGLTSAIGSVLLAQSGNSYANITDTSGLSLSHLFGSDTDTSTIDKYYSLLAQVCPGITNDMSLLNYGDNKSLYDALLALLLQDGSSKLLSQLLGCNTSSDLYFDNSSVKLLQEGAKNATLSGDAGSYEVVFNKLGQSNLTDVKYDMVVINANSDKSKAIDNAIPFDNMCSNLGINGRDLLLCDTSIDVPGTTYDASKVRLFTANNTYTADKYMTEDTRKLVQASIYLNS